jgi:hypothetical protein
MRVRGGKGVFAMLLALAALLVVVVPASSAFRIHVETQINPNGTGGLHVGIRPGSLKWEACTAALTGCDQFGSGYEIETKGAPVGTVFRVRDAEGEIGVSPEWKGPLEELAPPKVAGVFQANEFVSPVPGLWSGGWRNEHPEMQLSACVSEAGEECIALTNPHYISGCSNESTFPIDPSFAGRYLRVADRQSGGPHPELAYGVSAPYGAEVFRQEPNTSVAVVGQIAPAANPLTGNCGPPPVPIATISADGIARVECGGGCSVVLVGKREGRRLSASRQIPTQNLLSPESAREVQLPRGALKSLGVGKIRLIVEVDGTRLAQRTIRWP